MAHEIILGIDKVAATRAGTVWHAPETMRDGRLVDVEPAGDHEATMLRMAGIVWPVDADNDFARTAGLVTAQGTVIDSHMALLSQSGRVLGVVGADYSAIPYKVILTEWLLALARAGGLPETLGTYDAGRSMFASIQVADEWRVPGDRSAVRPMFNVVAHHGGGSISGSFSTFRVVCRNTAVAYERGHERTLGAAERAQKAWVSIAHTKRAEERIADAVKWITDGRRRAETEQTFMTRLADKLVGRAELDKFMADYISIPDDATKRATTIREKSRDEFVAAMQDAGDLGEHALTSKGITAYGLLQAVTQLEDWRTRIKNSDGCVGTRRAFRAFLGERETEKATARDYIAELVGVR